MFENYFIKRIIPYKLSSHNAWNYIYDKEVLKLDWNESSIEPSPLVKERILKEVKTGRLNWYPNTNNKNLISKIADYNHVKDECVQYFAGSDALHEYIVRAFIKPYDRVLVIGPTYDNFRAVAESNGARIQYYFYNKDFILDFSKFKKDLELIQPKIIYLVNPNNPTGTFSLINEIEDLINCFPEIFFIIDEAYYEFCGKTVTPSIMTNYNVLISRTFSKAFALASFRIGYALTSKKNIEILNKIRNPKNVSMFSQVAAEAALDSLNYTMNYVHEVIITKEIVYKKLSKLQWMKVINGEGNFLFIEINEIHNKQKLISYLEDNKVFIRDYGHIDCTAKFVRITIGTQLQMKIVCKLIKEFEKKILN